MMPFFKTTNYESIELQNFIAKVIGGRAAESGETEKKSLNSVEDVIIANVKLSTANIVLVRKRHMYKHACNSNFLIYARTFSSKGS